MERPRERGRGGLVSGDEEREHLVAQLLIGHRLPLLVARFHQHREDVGTTGGVAGAAPGDLGEEHLVHLAADAHQAAPRRPGPEVDLQQQDVRPGPLVEQRGQEIAQAGEPRALVDPEHRAQDHLERDALHLPVDREGPADGPAVHRGGRDVAHDLAVGLHALAVERRLHHPALAQVARSVEEEQGVLAHERLQERVGLAGAQVLAIAGEDLPDGLGVGEEDEGGTPRAGRRARDAGKADGEAVAVGPGAVLHERQRAADPVQHLQDARDGGAGRQGRHRVLHSVSIHARTMPEDWTVSSPAKFSAASNRRLPVRAPSATFRLRSAQSERLARRLPPVAYGTGMTRFG